MNNNFGALNNIGLICKSLLKHFYLASQYKIFLTHFSIEKFNMSWAVVAHAYNPSTWETETGESL